MRKIIQIILRINPRKKKRSVKRKRRIPNHKVVEKVLRGRNIRRIISIKKIIDDEPKVIKEEQSKKRIDEELEGLKVIKKEVEDELELTKERSSKEENKNKN